MFPQRNAGFLCFQIPTSSFDRRFGHAMTTHGPHQSKNLTGTFDLIAQNHRREKLGECRPAGVSPFVAIKRTFARGALSPSLGAVRIRNACEDDAAFSSA